MKTFLMLCALIVIGLILSGIAFAAAVVPPDPGSDPGGFLGWLYGAYASKAWPIVIAGVVFGAVFLVRKLPFAWIKGKVAGWILAFLPNSALAFIAAVGAGKPVLEALVGALMASALAAIGWEGLKDAKGQE